jgi:hypothetical protein
MNLLCSAVLLLLAACAAGSEGDARRLGRAPAPGAVVSDANGQAREAARLYVTKCARCHKLYNPADYSDAEWQSWVTKMGKKARLTPAQKELLIGYRAR